MLAVHSASSRRLPCSAAATYLPPRYYPFPTIPSFLGGKSRLNRLLANRPQSGLPSSLVVLGAPQPVPVPHNIKTLWVYTGDFERIDHLSPLRLHADNQHEALGASMRRAAKTSRSHQARFLREWRVSWPIKSGGPPSQSSSTVAWTDAMEGVEVRRAGARDRYKATAVQPEGGCMVMYGV